MRESLLASGVAGATKLSQTIHLGDLLLAQQNYFMSTYEREADGSLITWWKHTEMCLLA